MIGEIKKIIGDIPENWLECSGDMFDNSNGTFDKLIEMGIGDIVNGKYITPNFTNVQDIYCDNNEINMMKRFLNGNPIYRINNHIYKLEDKTINSYNNIIERFNDTEYNCEDLSKKYRIQFLGDVIRNKIEFKKIETKWILCFA